MTATTGSPWKVSEMREPERIPPASSIRSGLSSRTTVASRGLPPPSGPGRMWPRISLVCIMTTCVSGAAARETDENKRRTNARIPTEFIARNCTLTTYFAQKRREQNTRRYGNQKAKRELFVLFGLCFLFLLVWLFPSFGKLTQRGFFAGLVFFSDFISLSILPR